MRCPNCNSLVDDNAKFCEICGAHLQEGKKKSRFPIILICLIVFIASVGCLAVWVVNDTYHESGGKALGELALSLYPDPEEEDNSDYGKSTKSDGEQDEPSQDNAKEEVKRSSKAYDPTEGGIHRYELIVSDCTWSEAFQKCLDSGGYLVRINSDEEFEYIIQQINQKQMDSIQFKIGGRRDLGSEDYYWADENNQLYGEKINDQSYWANSCWMSGEPSISDGSVQENCLDIFYYENENRWVWNDVPDNILTSAPGFSGKLGYICEYEN